MNARRILVPTDFSEASDEVLRYAARYAASTNAKIAVCHTLPLRLGVDALFSYRAAIAAATDVGVESRVRMALKKQVAACVPTKKEHDDVEVFIENGSDYAGILHCAERWSADLIIVGSAGRSALSHVDLGTVAALVVRHAHCPVLVVKHAPHIVVATDAKKPAVVIVATDLSDPSMPAITAGAAEARRRDAKLIVVHAIDFASIAVTIEELVLANIDRMHWSRLDAMAWRVDGRTRSLQSGRRPRR